MFDQTPTDIWREILDWVSTDKYIGKRSLVSFARCSKCCRDLAYKHLYKTVDLSLPPWSGKVKTKEVSVERLSQILARSPVRYIEELVVYRSEDAPRPVLNRFIKELDKFTQLASLELRGVTMSPSELVGLARALCNHSLELLNLWIRLESPNVFVAMAPSIVHHGAPHINKLVWNVGGFFPNSLLTLYLSQHLTSITFTWQASQELGNELESCKLPSLNHLSIEVTPTTAFNASRFLENHPTITQLALGTLYGGDLILTSSALPHLQSLTSPLAYISLLVPRRPVEEVNWEAGPHFGDRIHSLKTFQKVLTQSAAKRIKYLSLPDVLTLDTGGELLSDVKILSNNPFLEALSLKMSFTTEDDNDPPAHLPDMSSLKHLKVFRLRVEFGDRVGQEEESQMPRDILKTTLAPCISLTHFIWDGMSHAEFERFEGKWKTTIKYHRRTDYLFQ